MKKIYSLFAAVIFAANFSAQSTTVTYAFSGENQTEVLVGNIDSNLVFVTAKGASAQSPTFFSAPPAAARFYSERTSGDGNELKISVASGYEITGLAFTGTTAATSPAVTYSVDGGAYVPMPLSETLYSVDNLMAATSLTFKNAHKGGTKNLQLHIPSFTVTYRVKTTMGVGNVNATKVNLVKNTVVGNTILFVAKADVQILNMNGQVVKTASVNENSSLEVSTLAKGMYVVTATVNGKAVSQKIIKK